MKIAVDAMGGDHAPRAIVEGAMLALEEFPEIEIILVGNQDEITPLLNTQHKGRYSVVHTTQTIATDEEPVKAVRGKKDSSLVQVTKLVKDKGADACLSAGNTGAYMTAGLLVTGRMKGIERPGLTIIYPTTERPCIILDVGANMDAKPEHLVQYATMGSIYAEKILGYSNPRVGLLSVGTEDAKGNELTKKTFPLLKETSLNFIGNIEARDVPFGVADIVVCDGFTGNVLLKLTEGVVGAIFSMLKEEFTKNVTSKMGALLLKPGLKNFKQKMDYSEVGGAPLLGLDGVCIKAHGSSNAIAIKNGIGQARKFLQHDVNGLIKKEVQKESGSE